MRGIVAACLLAACNGLGDRDVQTSAHPIVNGTIDSGDPATVYLDLGGGGCTGTLVSPKTVVTAKHCLSSQMEAFFGTDADEQGTWISMVHRSGHPQADIAMITLAEAGPAAPIPLNKESLTSHVGEQIRIAGFGVTSENGGGSGTKRKGVATLDSLDGGIMYATNEPSGTCYGDSGGPNFMTIGNKEVIIGVTSFGTAACGSGLDGSVRIDTYHAWIVAYIEAHDELPPEPTCEGDGLCAIDCSAPDPDCPCAADGHCTAACGDVASDPDCDGCGAGDTCRADCPALDTDCCATDGACNDTCGEADADCTTDGGDNGNNPDDQASGDGGCSTSRPTTLITFGVVLLFARRRRHSRGKR